MTYYVDVDVDVDGEKALVRLREESQRNFF